MTGSDVITVSGQPSSGTTSIGSALAEELNAAYLNGGAVFRSLATRYDIFERVQ